MSYQIENIREIYSDIKEPDSEAAEEIVQSVVISLINEGYSDSAIICYLEHEDHISIAEKYYNISEDYSLREELTEEYIEERLGRLVQGISKAVKFLSKQGVKDRKTIGKGIQNITSKIKGKASAIPVKGNQTQKMNAIKDNIRSRNNMPPIDRGGSSLATKTSNAISKTKQSAKDLTKKVGSKLDSAGKTLSKGASSVKATASKVASKAKNMSTGDKVLTGAGVVGGTAVIGSAVNQGNKEYDKAKAAVDKETKALADMEGGSKSDAKTTKTVNVTNRRGRVTGTKEVEVKTPSKQTKGGEPIRNRRGRVTGYTKGTDAEGKSFPSTAEIRAANKGKVGGGNAGASTDSGGTAGKTTVTPKPEVKVQKTSERDAWLKKTSNSPAAKAGLSDDQRWAARQKHVKFQKDNNRGPFRDPNKKAGGRKFNPSNKITSVMDMESYDAKGDDNIVEDRYKTDLHRKQDYHREPYDKKGRATGKIRRREQDTGRLIRSIQKDSYDAYDIVLNYLLETNQVETVEEANYVMLEMDSKTIQDIVNNK